jgi:peptidoglycan/xylan/chitin deacetylase (PgdA/CDA1 family)
MGLKTLISASLHQLGVYGLARRLHARKFRGATTLLYHRVMPDSTPPDHYVRLMGDPTASELEALLRYLKRWFRFTTPDRCVERWRDGREVDPYTMLLTFDDGYLDMHDELLPVLRRCEVPATLFVVTGAMGGYVTWCQRFFSAVQRTSATRLPEFEALPAMPLGSPAERVAALEAVSALQRKHPAAQWETMIDRLCERLGWDGQLDDERMMNWDQVARLHQSGLVMIGGHTVTHCLLERSTDDEAKRELSDCADELRSRLGTSFLPFSYPHGKPQTEAVERMTREAGFDCAFMARPAPNTSGTPLYRLGREYVPPRVSRASRVLSGLGRTVPAQPAPGASA